MKNKNIKYRYIMCGMFIGTDKNEYEINIPSPKLYDSEDEAMEAGNFGYRFALVDKSIGPQIVIYEKEDFCLNDDKQSLKIWVDGEIIKLYSFDEFKAAGGYIRKLKDECKGLGFIDANTDFIEIDSTFNDIFPNIIEGKLYYIDNEAYVVEHIVQGTP